MRRVFMKKGFCIILVLSLMNGLIGCNGSGAKGKEDSQLAKQNVYSYYDIPLEIETEDYNILSMVYSNDKVIVVVDINLLDEESDIYENHVGVYSCNIDGSDLQEVVLQKEDEESDITSSRINQTILGDDGSVYAVENSYKEDYTNPENPIYEEWMNLKCWNPDGTLHWVKSLEEFKTSPDDYVNIRNIFVDAEGNIYMVLDDNQLSIITMDANGTITNRKIIDNTVITNIDDIYMKKDNTLLILSYNDDWTKIFSTIYDPSTDTLGDKQEILVNLNSYTTVMGITTDFILLNSNGVYSYNLGDTEVMPIMNSINSDFASASLVNATMIDDTHFIGTYREIPTYKTKIAFFTKVNPEDIQDKEVLVLGMNYINSDITKRVVDFNKSNETYRIIIRDYSTYNTMADYTLSSIQMNNDIISGNMPDIMVADLRMPVSNYVAKGLVADIDKMIEEDEELSQVEFMDNVFQAYRINDKLHFVIPSFIVGTAIAKESIVGERNGWTMEEMQNIMKDLPEGTKLLNSDTTSSQFMFSLMSYCGSDFIDLSTGKCKFDSKEFIEILDLAMTLPKEVNYNNDDSMMMRDYLSQYRNNSTILMPTSFYGTSDWNSTFNGIYDGDFSFVGYPNENSNGSTINAFESFIISSHSKNIEGAWEFLRIYLTDEYQKNLQWGFPVSKECFRARAQEAMERPYYMEGDKKIEYDDEIVVNGESVMLDPMTQEQVDKVVSFIESVERPFYQNEEVSKIIDEETASLFSGQKSSKEVAEIIQNRVQLYVNESR